MIIVSLFVPPKFCISIAFINILTPRRKWKECLCKIFEGQTKSIMVFLKVTCSSLVSGNKSCEQTPTSTVTLKALRWKNLPDLIPSMNYFVWEVGMTGHWTSRMGFQSSYPQSSTEQANWKSNDQSSDLSSVVSHQDQQTTSSMVSSTWQGKPCGHRL